MRLTGFADLVILGMRAGIGRSALKGLVPSYPVEVTLANEDE